MNLLQAADTTPGTNAPATPPSILEQIKTTDDDSWSVETAYTARTEDFKRWRESVTVGLNYFATPGAGLHAGVALNDFDDQAIDLVEFGFIGRVPVRNSGVAFLFGVGSEHHFVNDRSQRDDFWAVYAEAGGSLQVYTNVGHPVALFAKIRGIRPVESADGEHVGIFGGMSFEW